MCDGDEEGCCSTSSLVRRSSNLLFSLHTCVIGHSWSLLFLCSSPSAFAVPFFHIFIVLVSSLSPSSFLYNLWFLGLSLSYTLSHSSSLSLSHYLPTSPHLYSPSPSLSLSLSFYVATPLALTRTLKIQSFIDILDTSYHIYVSRVWRTEHEQCTREGLLWIVMPWCLRVISWSVWWLCPHRCRNPGQISIAAVALKRRRHEDCSAPCFLLSCAMTTKRTTPFLSILSAKPRQDANRRADRKIHALIPVRLRHFRQRRPL